MDLLNCLCCVWEDHDGANETCNELLLFVIVRHCFTHFDETHLDPLQRVPGTFFWQPHTAQLTFTPTTLN